MLTAELLRERVDAGQNFATIADESNVSLEHVYKLARQNKIAEQPLRLSRDSKNIREPREFDALLADEPGVFNGIDTATLTRQIVPIDIARYYHGARGQASTVCHYTGETTDLLLSADGNQNNLLISNLLPLTRDVAEQRFADTAQVIEESRYTIATEHAVYRVKIETEHRYDKTTYEGADSHGIERAVLETIEPYVTRYTRDDILACFDCPVNDISMATWVWLRLERIGMVKGLSRVSFRTNPSHAAIVTKQMMNLQLQAVVNRKMNERVIARPTGTPVAKPNQIIL